MWFTESGLKICAKTDQILGSQITVGQEECRPKCLENENCRSFISEGVYEVINGSASRLHFVCYYLSVKKNKAVSITKGERWNQKKKNVKEAIHDECALTAECHRKNFFCYMFYTERLDIS